MRGSADLPPVGRTVGYGLEEGRAARSLGLQAVKAMGVHFDKYHMIEFWPLPLTERNPAMFYFCSRRPALLVQVF